MSKIVKKNTRKSIILSLTKLPYRNESMEQMKIVFAVQIHNFTFTKILAKRAMEAEDPRRKECKLTGRNEMRKAREAGGEDLNR